MPGRWEAQGRQRARGGGDIGRGGVAGRSIGRGGPGASRAGERRRRAFRGRRWRSSAVASPGKSASTDPAAPREARLLELARHSLYRHSPRTARSRSLRLRFSRGGCVERWKRWARGALVVGRSLDALTGRPRPTGALDRRGRVGARRLFLLVFVSFLLLLRLLFFFSFFSFFIFLFFVFFFFFFFCFILVVLRSGSLGVLASGAVLSQASAARRRRGPFGDCSGGGRRTETRGRCGREGGMRDRSTRRARREPWRRNRGERWEQGSR